MGCCCCSASERSHSPDEGDPLLSPQRDFRRGRDAEHFGQQRTARRILQCVCTSLCLWKPFGWRLIFSFLLTLLCVFELVYDLFVVCGCPAFDCRFLEKDLERTLSTNSSKSTHHSSFRKTSNTVYTLGSIGGLFSYTLLLLSLILMRRARRKYDSKAIGPSDALHDDLSNGQIKVIFSSQVVLTVVFVSSVGLFYYLVRDQPRDSWYFYLMILGVAAQFIAQWAAIVGCHVFGISSLSLGTLADDTVRRIRQMPQGEQGGYSASNAATTEQNGTEGTERSIVQSDPETVAVEYGSTLTSVGQNSHQKKFDIAVRYHEELCALVSDTVSAYCPWFVMHWLFYGATCLIGVIYISEEYTYSKNPLKLTYVTVFLITHVYMFLFPCFCAAYITDKCGGIYSRINKTTSDYWTADGHPFKERAQLMMFTAYAKERQCVFRIGRLTFTSTLAWVSLLLGSTGLLFHFF